MMSTFFLSDKFGSLQQIRQGVAKKKDFQLHYARPHCSVALYLHSEPSEAGVGGRGTGGVGGGESCITEKATIKVK